MCKIISLRMLLPAFTRQESLYSWNVVDPSMQMRKISAAKSHPSFCIFHLPAADRGMVGNLLCVHLQAAAVLCLVCLPQDGVEGLQCRRLPPEASYHKGNLHT